MSPLRLLLPLVLILPLTAHRLDASGSVPVTGEAVVLVVPDQVVITLGIESRAPQVAEAKVQNDAVLTKVLAALASMKIDATQVRTDCLEIAPYYRSNENLQPDYFSVSRTLTITLIRTDVVDQVLTDSITAGVTHIHNVEFRTTDLRRHRDDARRKAIQAAKDKATLLASEVGLKLGAATDINEDSNDYYGNSMFRRRADNRYQNAVNRAGSDAVGDTLVPAGMLAVRASVRVTFLLD
ncbi:MAG TPA: SIMPL domain-containing protein [Planctomycetota bacterium]|jgi:hypothetical protein|nr:SIMPL domain-containing protein [Planctomycetota bacterium]